MPWKATSVTDQRVKFMLDYSERARTGQTTMLALCAEHGVSRKTGYKIVARYEQSGWQGLGDHSRAPVGGKHWISSETISTVLDVRLEYPQWGSRKIVAYLRDIEPDPAMACGQRGSRMDQASRNGDESPRPPTTFPPSRPAAVCAHRTSQPAMEHRFQRSLPNQGSALLLSPDCDRLVQPLHHRLSGFECDHLRADLERVRQTLSRARVTRCHPVRQRNTVLIQLGQGSRSCRFAGSASALSLG